MRAELRGNNQPKNRKTNKKNPPNKITESSLTFGACSVLVLAAVRADERSEIKQKKRKKAGGGRGRGCGSVVQHLRERREAIIVASVERGEFGGAGVDG